MSSKSKLKQKTKIHQSLRTVEWKNNTVVMIDQTKLPNKLVFVKYADYKDVATQVDKISENCIVQIISESDSNPSIVTEENGDKFETKDENYWVVDALDGTVNYVNHIPFYCVSIAYFEKNLPIVGVIYNPMSKDLYYGADGIGVFKNQKKLQIKDLTSENCLFAVAFSGKKYDPQGRREEFLLFGDLNDSSRGCLRTGSASMNLAYLSEGKFGGCWGKANKLWDVSAGLLIARLAGAKVEFSEIDKEKHLVSYIATVPLAWDFVYRRANHILGLNSKN